MNSTRFEIEQEIKAREKIIDHCNELIEMNNRLIKDKWTEIKDFVNGNSAEKANEGATYIKMRQKEIRDKQTEIGRKKDQIANYRAMLSFRDR